MKVVCVNNGKETRSVNNDVTVNDVYDVIYEHTSDYYLTNDNKKRLMYPKDMFITLDEFKKEIRNKKLLNIGL
jgi:hypothetical protein